MCTNDILCKVYTCVLKCCTAYISRIATLSENDKYILHYDDVTMSLMASQITSLTIVYSTVYSGADQRKHQSSASLAFVRGIHRGPVNSPHKWPVTPKMFPFDDVIMIKSPWYTGGDFYVFVPFRTPAPATGFCPRDNFWTTFSISFIFGTIVGPDL